MKRIKSQILNKKILSKIPSPSFIIDESLLKKNLELMSAIQLRTKCKILLALKAFSMYSIFPKMRKYLSGVCASSLFEARLGYEEFQKEVHIFSPAYIEKEFDEIMKYCDHIVFNSFGQIKKYKNKIKNSKKKISAGIRINPEYSEIKVDMYNPCVKYSRLGITLTELQKYENEFDEFIEGIHFHTHCEQNVDSLERTLQVIEKKFDKYLRKVKWLNFGGGHHITREDYKTEKLCEIIEYFRDKYEVEIYLEPGEAIVLNTGFLLATVLDIFSNEKEIAILDISAATHTPDVLEMPYRPYIIGSGEKNEYKYNYRLGGVSCLAGDVIGDYSFPKPLKIGDKLLFTDMAHYTMVKTNMFNGINLPSIVLLTEKGEVKIIRKFKYEDYKMRLS
ncbi:MAG TPA: carboxynorspermidine decarboxylase [bacterium]|nr:carboxynorspermidine decarboxylase [bacterium]HOL47582.1 carboxynorspermidine decarboxylase [bacterium]HPQ18844.1 carboxynorspermidine decarboxylase [bacterium]